MNPNKKIFFLIFVISTYLISCNYSSEKLLKELKKQWVYVELTVVSPTDTTDYFYFGKIKKSIIDKIDSNENKKGFFKLSNIRYWNDDDLLEIFEDEKLNGDKIFKIQDIEEITLYKDDPINLFDLKELHKSAKEIKTKNK